jgi:hypothetical protein
MNQKIFKISLVNSLAVTAYIILVAYFMQNAENWFGKEDKFLAPVIFLLLFVLSALITGLLVLGRPIYFYLEGKKVESIRLLFYTIINLAVILAIVILAYLGLR